MEKCAVTNLNDAFAFERLQRRIDDPQNRSVLVIIENEDGTIDTAYRGDEGDAGMFALAFSIASQVGDEVLHNLTDEQRAEHPIILPTREQARDMGLVKPIRRRR